MNEQLFQDWLRKFRMKIYAERNGDKLTQEDMLRQAYEAGYNACNDEVENEEFERHEPPFDPKVWEKTVTQGNF